MRAISTVVIKENTCTTPRDQANQKIERATRARSEAPPVPGVVGAGTARCSVCDISLWALSEAGKPAGSGDYRGRETGLTRAQLHRKRARGRSQLPDHYPSRCVEYKENAPILVQIG